MAQHEYLSMAYEDLQRRIEQGDTDAMVEFAWRQCLARRRRESARWYLRAAELGNPRGMYNVSTCYFDGYGLPKDGDKAMTWAMKASALGHLDSIAQVGWYLETGTGAPKDQAKALRWYRKSARQGGCMGQENLGECYENGKGVRQDLAEAIRWYRLSAAQVENHNHTIAMDALKRLGVLES